MLIGILGFLRVAPRSWRIQAPAEVGSTPAVLPAKSHRSARSASMSSLPIRVNSERGDSDGCSRNTRPGNPRGGLAKRGVASRIGSAGRVGFRLPQRDRVLPRYRSGRSSEADSAVLHLPYA